MGTLFVDHRLVVLARVACCSTGWGKRLVAQPNTTID